MIPDKFNLVDMGGNDLLMMQGETVPGLYQKLHDAISNCRYQCLYNWIFDGVLIPPTYVQLSESEQGVFINEGISVTNDDVIHIYSIEPPAPEPVINPISIVENGTYSVPVGVDGFNPVVVDVPLVSSVDICSVFTGSYGANDASLYLVKLRVTESGITILEPLYNLSFYPFYRGEIDHYDFGDMVRIRYVTPNWYADAIGDRVAYHGKNSESGSGSYTSGQNIFAWDYRYCTNLIVR